MADLLPAVSWLNEAKCAGYLRVVRWNRLAYLKSNAGSRSVELAVTPDVRSFPYSFSSRLLVALDSFLQVSLVFSAGYAAALLKCVRQFSVLFSDDATSLWS